MRLFKINPTRKGKQLFAHCLIFGFLAAVTATLPSLGSPLIGLDLCSVALGIAPEMNFSFLYCSSRTIDCCYYFLSCLLIEAADGFEGVVVACS